jgi:uncharacterized protein (TIGR03546 family)
MLILLKLTRSLYNTFAGAMSPTQIAYGMCLGLFVTLMPFGVAKAQTLAIFGLLLTTRASWGLFGMTAALVLPAMKALGGQTLLYRIGYSALEMDSLKPTWQKVLNLPGIALVELDHYAVMGGFLLALAGSIVLFFPLRWGITWFRTNIQPRADQYRVVRWWRGFFLTRALSYIFVGSGTDQKG